MTKHRALSDRQIEDLLDTERERIAAAIERWANEPIFDDEPWAHRAFEQAARIARTPPEEPT